MLELLGWLIIATYELAVLYIAYRGYRWAYQRLFRWALGKLIAP